MKIIDTSSNTTDQVSCIASEGVQTIFRYYTSTANWKVITLSEAEAISNAGMQIGVVFEDGNDLDFFTEQIGYNNAVSAYTYATQTIDQPCGSAIYFAIDLNVTDAQIQSNIIPYFKGIQNGFKKLSTDKQNYKVGAYGCGAAINELLIEGLCEFRWLSESSSYNGTEEALTNNNYELAQQYKADLEICTIVIDQDNPREGVTDFGGFTLKDD